jgi:beta-glucosidase
MLKHQTMIDQLSDHDKIRLLCDIGSLGDKDFKVLGLPEIKLGVQAYDAPSAFPSPMTLANTWDTGLVRAVANETLRSMAAEGVNLAVLPGANVRVAYGDKSLSEDALLSTTVAGEYLRAAEEHGVAACLSGFSLARQDMYMLDQEPGERFIREYLVRPYAMLTGKASCAAILTAKAQRDDACDAINATLTKSVLQDHAFAGIRPICEKANAESMIEHLQQGGIFFEGLDITLQAALQRYRHLKKKIEHGTATAEELQADLESGKAFSDEMLDAAVDRLIEFAYAVQRKGLLTAQNKEEVQRLALRAARESIVLLKNKGRLPLKKKIRIGFVGDIAFTESEAEGDSLIAACAEELNDRGFVIAGAERGYDIEEERSPHLISAALTLAAQSDVVIVFLGFGEERQKRLLKRTKVSVPANQQHLLDELGTHGAKVIAVLGGDYSPDVVLEQSCDAIVYASLDTPHSVQALVEVLTGEQNPCGRLANTVYLHSDEQYALARTYRRRDGIQTGPFIGYRYYDKAGYCPGYAFGHGLSYTEFTYSDLSVHGNKLTLTVANTGKRAGSEVVQVYVGAKHSRILRPKRELAAFAKITLAPHEKRKIELFFDIPEIYDEHTSAWITEKTTYTVDVGASIADIRLSCEITAGEREPEPDGKRLSDYIQSESNVLSDDYKLETRGKTMKKSLLHIVAGGVALLLAIILKLYCAFARVESLFLDFFAIALGVCGIAFFIMEAVYRNQAQKALQAENEKATNAHFEEAEKIPFYNAEEMFVEEFERANEEKKAESALHVESAEVEALMYIDKEQTFANAAQDFAVFAAEKGYRFAPEVVNRLFASLASSRLLLVRGMSDQQFSTLMLLLSNFFETSIYLDTVDESYISDDCVLYKPDGHGGKSKTQAHAALEDARRAPQHMHFAALRGVHLSSLSTYFSTYAAYAGNPSGNYGVKVTISTYNGFFDTTYFIPRNLWFVLNVAEEDAATRLPAMLYDTAACCTLPFEQGTPSGQHTMVRKFSYYQMDYLTERVSQAYQLNESLWKKVDRLEAFVNACAPYHIGNKRWLGLERFAFVYKACSGEEADALDEALAAKLLPSMMATVAGKMSAEDKSLAEAIDEILGEEHTEICHQVLRAAAADQA